MAFTKRIAIAAFSTFIASAGVTAQEQIKPDLILSRRNLLSTILENYTVGNDPFYSKVISANKSLDVTKSDSDRIKEANAKMLDEVDSVITAFANASEGQKQEAVAQGVNAIDKELVDTAEVDIQFVDGTPSSGIARTVLLIEKKTADITAEKVMDVLSSYKRSAKPSDFVYEYENVENLTQGEIKEIKSSDTSWKLPEASPAVILGNDLAIKKCRQLMGWRCATSLYSVGQLKNDPLHTKYLFMGSYDLKNNPDHTTFKNDARSKNQVIGNSTLYVAVESEKWVLIYGVDAQINSTKLAFTALIQEAYEKDFTNLQERMVQDLKLDRIVNTKSGKKPHLSFKEKIAKFFLKIKQNQRKRKKSEFHKNLQI